MAQRRCHPAYVVGDLQCEGIKPVYLTLLVSPKAIHIQEGFRSFGRETDYETKEYTMDEEIKFERAHTAEIRDGDKAYTVFRSGGLTLSTLPTDGEDPEIMLMIHYDPDKICFVVSED